MDFMDHVFLEIVDTDTDVHKATPEKAGGVRRGVWYRFCSFFVPRDQNSTTRTLVGDI